VVPVSLPRQAGAALALALRNAARLALRRRRTPTVSADEYEAHWQRVIDDRALVGGRLVDVLAAGVARDAKQNR
jgi:hypothetical protein